MPKALTITGPAGKPGQVYYPLSLLTTEPSTNHPTPTSLTLKLLACSLNHRDLFIRKHLYPGIAFFVPLLADGCGLVVSAGPDPDAQDWLGKRVVINPGTGWREDPNGPEPAADGSRVYKIMGGTRLNPTGTAQEYMVVEASEVVEAPAHLSAVEAAALPLTGLTAWRALVVKAGVVLQGPEWPLRGRRKNVLVTGIGGGVALMALVFLGAADSGSGVEGGVWVTSGNEEKIARAVELGAKGGVSYTEERWEDKVLAMLRRETRNEAAWFDVIVDGAGGDVVEKGAKILKPGGVIVSYGMTLGPKMPFSMQAVLKNIELKGSTMGSRKEFHDMIEFVRKERVKPVISRTVQGLDNIEAIDGLFEDMKKGSQFGKLVIEIAKEERSSESRL